jgi:hypothetical protein
MCNAMHYTVVILGSLNFSEVLTELTLYATECTGYFLGSVSAQIASTSLPHSPQGSCVKKDSGQCV